MALSLETKSQLVTKYQRFDRDTGSPEVQIALLSTDIAQLTQHFHTHPKDNHSRRGLLAKVSRRHKLLRYLKSKNRLNYQHLIKQLGLRDKA